MMLSACDKKVENTQPESWKGDFEKVLPLLGHRNWVLVVDKAFPLQNAAGMNLINTGEEIEEVLSYVLERMDSSTHVTPIIYTDKELEYIPAFGEKETAIVERYHKLLSGVKVNSILHEEVFSKLDEASKLFSVVVLKTECTIPYTSVFMELDCRYWSGVKEEKLRALMEQGK